MKHKAIPILTPLILRLALALSLPLIFSTTAMATITVEVDTTLDSNAPAYQACTAAPDDCSLRGAISKANADAANAYIINIPAGVHTLTLTGAEIENANATGDLDIANAIRESGGSL